ncbi:hypothetical protein EVAR_93217_1 [Eumeta japonica]|uniref:Uncharacterized protein n=1 Tax=Eumeta variegata TaxID=151549 RepID=A0A4C1TXL8_EUMVA|nr:hypothetical protein EVAR_93217_1 [Eumeta japonica]
MLEAEHIVNFRPLMEVDIEPTEAEGLTPNHFLEYLPTLVPCLGHGDPTYRASAEDDIVMSVGPPSARYSWRRDKSKKTYLDSDNQVCVVDVEKTGGDLQRPCLKIAMLVSRGSEG